MPASPVPGPGAFLPPTAIGLGIVPTEFDVLVDGLVTNTRLKKEINALIEAKRRGAELDNGPQITPINRFLEQELNRFSKYQIDHEKHFAPMEDLNRAFFSALEEILGFTDWRL